MGKKRRRVEGKMSDEPNPKTSPFSLSNLPEGCISNIISFMSPKDACRAAAVSLGFKSAADSDTVWERFLPPNYRQVISRASSRPPFSNKKHLYLFLHDASTSLLLDGGKLSFELCESGVKCYTLSAKALQIASVDNPEHWEWISFPESRFAEVAKLRGIKRLEILGVMPARMLSPNTTYAAWLKYKPYCPFYGLDYPSKAVIKFVKEDGTELVGETIKVFIDCSRPHTWSEDGRISWCFDGWHNLELGDFFINEGAGFDVHIEVCETECLNLKKGLILEGIDLVPRHRPSLPELSVLRDRS